MVFYSIE